MDRAALFAGQFPEAASLSERLAGLGLVASMREGGRLLVQLFGDDAWIAARTSQSDTVRGWGAMAIAAADVGSSERLALLRTFADDQHFAVREWAWLALRADVVADPVAMLEMLRPWTQDESPRIRRFASEATRPRGVWSTHVPLLKREPRLGEPLLDPLRADRSRYVQNSVANWLNDTARTRPDWLRSVTRRWSDSRDPATRRICERAVRSLPNSAEAGRRDLRLIDQPTIPIV